MAETLRGSWWEWGFREEGTPTTILYPEFGRCDVTPITKFTFGANHAQPTPLPTTQPTKLKLVLNLKTASALGVGFPQSLILSADEMIGA